MRMERRSGEWHEAMSSASSSDGIPNLSSATRNASEHVLKEERGRF